MLERVRKFADVDEVGVDFGGLRNFGEFVPVVGCALEELLASG